MTNEFYIGYEPEMPPRLARQIRRVAAGLLALSLLVPALVLAVQRPFAEGVFEYGRPRLFEGRVIERPYPLLDVDGSLHLLVAPYKFGAAGLVNGLDGATVRLRGTLIHREGQRMIEIRPGSIEQLSRGTPPPLVTVGATTVVGELVDPKCHLGVMKPGERQLHRDCAVRCLSGGIPPMFVARTAGSTPRRLLLLTSDGNPVTQPLASLVGRPLTLSGTLMRTGDRWFLAAHGLR